ncbi:hypothetical protein M0805_001199 [Coniferiporia weirii]|nr:hypothetical protein M0805_001199 [Coniferiporia weirii]
MPIPLKKEKTCPHYRAVSEQRETWQKTRVKPSETRETGTSRPSADAWKGVLKPDDAWARTLFNTLVNLSTGGGTAEVNEDRERGGDHGFYDNKDNMYRCHEIWDDICTACGRLYPGLLDHAEHDEDGDDKDGDDNGDDWMVAHGHADYEDTDKDVLDLHEIFGKFACNARFIPPRRQGRWM